jgi:hypothetical protein
MILFLVTLLLLFGSTAHGATTIQSTAGDCSPTVANVTGKVDINCSGIDAKALNRLNELLDLKDRDLGEARRNLDDKIQEANEWARKYHELEVRFSSSGEINELSIQAEQALKSGDFVKAGAILDQLLTQQQGEIDSIAANHYSRAQLYDLQFQPQLALPHYEKAYRYRPETFEYAVEYARTLQLHNDFITAEAIYGEQLAVLRRYATVNPTTYQPRIAIVLSNLGLVYVGIQKLRDAENVYKEALPIWRELAAANPIVYRFGLFMILNNLTSLYSITGRFTDASIALKEGFAVYREMFAANPTIYPPGFASVIDNLTLLIKRDSWSFLEAEKVVKQYLTILRSLAASNPAAFRPFLALTLNSLASLYEDYAFWIEAVTTYEESLNIIRELAATNPAAYRPALAGTLRKLALLYSLTWKITESQNAYQEALTIYRDLAAARPAVYKPVVASILSALVRKHVINKDLTQAENDFQESIALYRELVEASPTTYQPELADTLLSFAILVARPDRTREELRYAEEAVEIYRHLWQENSDRYNTLRFSNAVLVLTMVVSRSEYPTPTTCQLAREVEIVAKDKDIQNSVGLLLQRACH